MLPSPLTILAAVVAFFFAVLTVVRGPVDADYWWHLTTGRIILGSGAVPSVDPFSFAYDGPWVAHEWLGEVVIAGLVDSVGFAAAALLFGLAAAAAILVTAAAVHRAGARTAAILPFTVLATYGIASSSTVRPQVLSWLLLGMLLLLLIGLKGDHRVRPWLAVPLMVAWANLHGLYVVGLGVIGIYAVATLLGRTPMASRRWTPLALLGAATAACAMTPAGVAGLVYPVRYLRQDDWGTGFIAEWQALDVTDPRQWAVIGLVLACLILVRQLRPDWLTAVGVLGIIGALVAARNGPIAMIAALPMLSLALERRLSRQASHAERSARAQRQRRRLETLTGLVVSAAIAIVLPAAASGSEAGTFPTRAFDRLAMIDADAHLFVDYDWAGYAIHRIYGSGGEVFIDGRSDMYPRAVFDDYLAIRGAEDGWEALLKQYGVEAILVSPEAGIAGAAAAKGWCEVYRDAASVLLVPCGG